MLRPMPSSTSVLKLMNDRGYFIIHLLYIFYIIYFVKNTNNIYLKLHKSKRYQNQRI